MENHGEMALMGETPDFVHQSSLTILPAESSGRKAGGTGIGNYEFCLAKYVFHTSEGSVTCRKIE
jgi:hypothetical protein